MGRETGVLSTLIVTRLVAQSSTAGQHKTVFPSINFRQSLKNLAGARS
jgi:hypothetical protein